MPLELNEANFEENTEEGLVLVDFYATWCGPCRALSPILEQVQNVKVFKVDTDANQRLATQFNISALPTLVFMKDGEEVDRVMGLWPLEQLQQKVDEIQ
jgi:thioredoxin 1